MVSYTSKPKKDIQINFFFKWKVFYSYQPAFSQAACAQSYEKPGLRNSRVDLENQRIFPSAFQSELAMSVTS